MPVFNNNDEIKFKNINYQHPLEFKIYGDFECYLKKVDIHNNNIHYYQEHKIMGFMLYLVCDKNKKYNRIEKYIGENAGQKFFESLEKLKNYVIKKIRKQKKPMIITNKQEIKYSLCNECYICNKPYTDSNNYKVRVLKFKFSILKSVFLIKN